jgi:hypothetical protein
MIRDVCVLFLDALLSAHDRLTGPSEARRVPPDYSAIWPRLEEAMFAEIASLDGGGDADALAELLHLPHDRRLALFDTSPRFHSVRLAWLLLERCGKIVPYDPCEAEQLAQLVLAITVRLEPTHQCSSLKADLLAHAWGLIGDARRQRHDWGGAEEAFESAQTALDGSLDPLEEASFCHLLAQLRVEQGRLIEGTALQEWARTLLEESGQVLCVTEARPSSGHGGRSSGAGGRGGQA